MNTVFSSWGSAARLPRALLAAGVVCVALVVANPARAQSEASAALSMLPVASVVGTASVASAAAGAVVTVPAALSVGGAVLTVRAVEASAVGTVYLLERASDGTPPDGGKWPPRYAARRIAWHALDHAWEIEDRVI